MFVKSVGDPNTSPGIGEYTDRAKNLYFKHFQLKNDSGNDWFAYTLFTF